MKEKKVQIIPEIVSFKIKINDPLSPQKVNQFKVEMEICGVATKCRIGNYIPKTDKHPYEEYVGFTEVVVYPKGGDIYDRQKGMEVSFNDCLRRFIGEKKYALTNLYNKLDMYHNRLKQLSKEKFEKLSKKITISSNSPMSKSIAKRIAEQKKNKDESNLSKVI
jgi:hypothetical protein